MSAHTPGPWLPSTRNNNDAMLTFHGVVIGGVYIDITSANEQADVRLIAAAPDGLALARYAVDNPDFDSETFDRMAREFIAKATGEAR